MPLTSKHSPDCIAGPGSVFCTNKYWSGTFYFLQLFHNDDVNPKKTIKKKRFLKEENINEIRHWVGNKEELDWEAEFDQIDDDKDGKITFEIFVR